MLHFIKEKTLNVATVSLLSLASLAIATPSWGVAIDFSSSDWNKIGDSAAPTQGQITLKSGTLSTIYIDDLETFLDITPGTLDSQTGSNLTTTFGSATTYSAKAGDSVSFQWNFTQNENDFAFVKLNNQIQRLDSNSPTFNAIFSTDQLFGIGVVNVGDSIGTSTLQVSNANYQPVPEPISIFSSLTACGFGVVIRRRFGKKS